MRNARRRAPRGERPCSLGIACASGTRGSQVGVAVPPEMEVCGRMDVVLVLLIAFTILSIVDKIATIVLIRMSQKNSRPSGKR